MELRVKDIGSGIQMIEAEGEMDLYNSHKLKDIMNDLWNKNVQSIILDLEKLTYLDSSGVGVLIYVYTTIQKRKFDLWITNVSGSVKKVIELTKLNNFLPIAESNEAALEALRRHAGPGTEQESSVSKDQTKREDGIPQILVDSASPLFRKNNMYHKELSIDYSKIRYLSNIIAQKAPPEIREFNLLEQQICEIIKNAVKHGNRMDPAKKIKIWFSFSKNHAHLIVEDEGVGFQKLEEWNRFYRKKVECFRNHNFDEITKYLSFRTENSDDSDGGNALFAAVEYWNEGVVFNEKRNAVAVKKYFN